MRGASIPGEGVATALRHLGGIVELGSHVGGELVALAQELHAASVPGFAWGAHVPASVLFGSLRFACEGSAHAAAWSGRLVPRARRADAWLDLQSSLNGAYGHLFAARQSGFAIEMSLQRPARRSAARRLVVFLHGLSMNERAWRNAAHAEFRDWAGRHLDAETAYLRYNTGLRISTNGRLLAQLLEREGAEAREIVLVGHSMGGLVARSAVHQGEALGLDWPRRVTHLASVGSPHEGTTLEQIGNHANRMLRLSPWTRPFMRLWNLRSDGIRDLRFGHLVEEDWRHRHIDDPSPAFSRVPLARHVDHVHVAGARARKGRLDPSGDWLVPLPSALAENLHPGRCVRRELVRGVGHLAMLGCAQVYARLEAWLRGRS